MDIFKLVGSVFIDTDEANKSLQKTDKKAETLGDTLASGAKKAGKFAIGLGTAAAGAVTALVGVASSAADTMDVIDKASQRMDISAESYQELAHAASLSGVEMSTLEKAAKKLEGTDLNMDDALAQIYELGTAEERSAKAAELFGEAVAYQMSPMLNASAEDMAAMKQEAHDLGLVLDQDTVSAGAALNDTLNNIKDALGGLVTNLGASLLPIVQQGADMLLEFLPTIQEIINKIAPVLSEFLSALLPILLQFVETILPPILTLAEALLPLLQLLCELILPLITTLVSALAKLLTSVVIPAITKVVTTIKDAVQKAISNFETAKTKVISVFEAIKEGVKKPINGVIGMINKMIDALNALSFDIPDWVPVLGGKSFGFNLTPIPLLANGGDVVGGGKAIVGEAGAELIDLPQGARVTPLTKGEDALNTKAMLATMQEMLATMKEQNDNLVMAFSEALNNTNIKWDDRQIGRMINKYA